MCLVIGIVVLKHAEKENNHGQDPPRHKHKMEEIRVLVTQLRLNPVTLLLVQVCIEYDHDLQRNDHYYLAY